MSLLPGFVVNLLWQTLLLSVLGYAALRLAANASAPTRAALALASLAALLAMPLPNLFFLAVDSGWFKRAEPAVQTTSGATWRFNLSLLGGAAATTAKAAPAAVILEPVESSRNVAAELRASLRRWAPLAGTVWAAGAVFMLLRLLYGLTLLRGFRLGLRRIDDSRFAAAMASAAAFSPGHRPDVFLSSEIESPLTIGLFRPVMVLPEKLYGALKTNEIRSIVLHELSHIHHHDHLAGLVKRVVAAVNWWNPLVHIINAAHSVAREEVSDNYALTELGPKAYAGCLVELAEKTCLISGLPATIGMADIHVSLEQRVRGILSNKRKLEMRTNKAVRNVAMTCFCGLAALLGGAQYALAQESSGRASLGALVMPGANVMVKFDLERAVDSPIYKRLEAARRKPNLGGLDLGTLDAKLKEHGLLDNGGKSFTMYMAMDDLFFDSPGSAGAMRNLGLLFGVELKKTVDMKLVEDIAQAMVAANKPTSDQPRLERVKYKGYKLLSVTTMLPGAGAGVPTKFLLGMDADGKLLFGGLAESVKAAIARMESGKNAALSPEMLALSKTGPFGAQYQLVINVPDKMRRNLRTAVAKDAAALAATEKPMDPGMAFKQLDSMVVAARLGDNLELDVRGNFAKPEASQFLNGMLAPWLMTAKMSLPKLADGKPATLLEETLKSEATPSSATVKLSASLSPQDVDLLGKSPLLAQLPGMKPVTADRSSRASTKM